MLKANFQTKFLQNETILILLLYLSLLISFYFGENSTGGAITDYYGHNNLAIKLFRDFFEVFFNYDEFHTRHSPVFLVILGFLDEIFIFDNLKRLFLLHIFLLLPILFYQCLKIKFNIDRKILILLTSLIFISPTFRSLSIWPDSRLFGLLFFTLSIFCYLKFTINKKFSFVLLNILTCALSAYISPNYSVFSLFFFFQYLSKYKVASKEIFLIILSNIIIALPALYYIFILDINFLNKSAAIKRATSDIFFVNIFNDILITFTFVFFYILPFIFFKIIKIVNPINIKNFILTFIIFFICSFYFDYDYQNTGGGVFLKASQLFLGNNHFFFLISFVSIMVILPTLIINKNNFLIFILIILNNPQYTMYHKYFDPFLLIIFFTIFKFDVDLKKLLERKKFIFVFFYFLCFLIISNIKFIWKI